MVELEISWCTESFPEGSEIYTPRWNESTEELLWKCLQLWIWPGGTRFKWIWRAEEEKRRGPRRVIILQKHISNGRQVQVERESAEERPDWQEEKRGL